ncbi:hypothetical protein KIF24_26770 [Micromonospora sp. Llam7]|uniref:hypothetical protein n=1 Tax=Micromonospora tarapacensis TaxID=2835305 RepID=UPI001C830D26|nr:hypothetical protein [Micromonospora tarapacensis]MBX7269266.1 hypothetical protein [Micromonospora tarapacensis]
MNDVSGGRDNPSDLPNRSVNVPSDELEGAVREALSRRVAIARAVPGDAAGAAIRRANRIQRRRTLAGVSLAAVAIVLVGAGSIQLRANQPPAGGAVMIGDPDRPPVGTRSIPPGPDTETPLAEVDLVFGETIATAQGRRVPLHGTGVLERAHRLTDGHGWLAVGAPTLVGRFLWSVGPDGTAQVLLAGADEIVLDREGRQVAWKQGTVLAAAGIVNGELAGTVRAEAPAEAMPLRFVDGAVLVKLASDRPGHVLWRLSPGPLDQGTDRASLRVFDALPDGRLVGEVAAGPGQPACLTVLDPARNLAPAQPDCGPRLGGDGQGTVSPDGRWLLVNGHSGGQDAALLVDLGRLDPSAEVRRAGPAMVGTAVWSAPDTAYYADSSGGLVRVAVDRAVADRPARPTALPGLSGGEIPVVVSGG